MITPINIALLGVVLAAVALIIMRRRHSGATDEAVSHEMPDEVTAAVDEPVAASESDTSDVFSKHIWAESAATMAPVREDEAVADAHPDTEDELEAEGEADDEADDEAEGEADDDAEDLDAPEGDTDQDTGEIPGLELEAESIPDDGLEAMSDPDDGLGGIITEPGWYLPGETDMTRGSPAGPSGSLVPLDDPTMAGGLLHPDLEPASEATFTPVPEEVANDFSAAAAWTAPAEDGEQPAEPGWLGLGDDEGAATAAVGDEVSFEVTPDPSEDPSEDLFELPPLEQGLTDEGQELGSSSFPLDQWRGPVAPSPSFALEGAPAGVRVAQHGPLTVSVDPAAMLAIETEAIERSSRSDGTVSWELTLKVELRQRGDGSHEAG